MGLIPDTKVGKIEFAENHVTTWTDNAVAIGSSAPAVSAWSTKVTAARAAYTDQLAAQAAAKVATANLTDALQSMMDATSSIIKQVGAKAKLSGDSIWTLASLPVPATPSPKPAPGTPTELAVEMTALGPVDLTWKCNNPEGTSGTQYQVWRKIDGATAVFLGTSGKKTFVDNSLPAGAISVVYQIRATRSTAAGPWASFNVQFGTPGSGVTITTVNEAAPVKKAA